MATHIYILVHTYKIEDIYNESKFIGIFSSMKDINRAIDFSIQLPGFRDYPRDCFIVTKYLIDDYTKWIDGFNEEELELLY